MRCKLCREDIRPDCVFDVGICVFCWHDTDNWDPNGQPVTRDQVILRDDQGKAKPGKVKDRVHLPEVIRRIRPYVLHPATVVIARDSATSAIDVDLLADLIAKCEFRVLRVDFAGVLGSQDVALRLARALDQECTDLHQVMRTYTKLQDKRRICVIVENFDHMVVLDRREARNIERTMRDYQWRHENAAWVFFGTRDMLPAFTIDASLFWRSCVLLIEEIISRPGEGT